MHPSGTLLLDKPSGITSARAVAQVKRLLPRKTRIGHTGTLDPLATGLLVLMIGRATRLSRYVIGLDKSYITTANFGAISDTLDAEGEITRLDASMPTEEALRAATGGFSGRIHQTPPMTSAVKIGGERLYNLHRRGTTVDRESRAVEIHAFELLSLDPDSQTATFEISCSSGTYVRTLISDLATSQDTGAYVTALRRTRVGHLHVEEAVLPDQLTHDTIQSHLIHPRRTVTHLPVLSVEPEMARTVRHGRPLEPRAMQGSFRVECGGEFLAVYRGDGSVARAEVVLCAA